MTEKIFNGRRAYKRAENNVYCFHQRVYNTVLAWLQGHGDRIITEDDNKPEPWRFCFLDMEGRFEIKAVRLTDSKKDFYLDAVDEDGRGRAFDWSDINHDMIIVEMLMGLVFNK